MSYLSSNLLAFLQDPNEDLNEKIRACISNSKLNYLINYKTFNGSPFPFIGPEWLEVDFDSEYLHFRYIPIGHKVNKTNSHLVGFCQDVKFDYYPEIVISGDVKDKVVGLVHKATTFAGGLINKSVPLVTDAFADLDNCIQALGTDYF